MLIWENTVGIGRGKNISGAYFSQGYILIYARYNSQIVERKIYLGNDKPENFDGVPVSMSDILAKNSQFCVEMIGGILRLKN